MICHHKGQALKTEMEFGGMVQDLFYNGKAHINEVHRLSKARFLALVHRINQFFGDVYQK